MYILETPYNVEVACRNLFDLLADMFRRLLLCFTAFLATTGIISSEGALSNLGVQGQYLLGLGKSLIGGSREYQAETLFALDRRR